MQVTLNLDVERMLPDCIRRRFIVKQQTVYPNEKRGMVTKILREENTLNRITKGVVDDGQVSGLSQAFTDNQDSGWYEGDVKGSRQGMVHLKGLPMGN